MSIDIRHASSPAIDAFFARHPNLLPPLPIQCPPGWDTRVAQALEELDALAIDSGAHLTLLQIKEKLAGLRIYFRVDGEDLRERAREVITAAEVDCATRCQVCGAPGSLYRGDGPLRIACLDHVGSSPGA